MWLLYYIILYTFKLPKTIVRAENTTWDTASTKMKICRSCNAFRDNNGTFP